MTIEEMRPPSTGGNGRSAMYQSTACPQCRGPRDTKALYCPFCGTIFDRHGSRAPQSRPPAQAPLAKDGSKAGSEVNPYRAPAADLYNPDRPVVFDRPYRSEPALASRGQRLGAHLLDAIFVGVATLAMTILLALTGSMPESLADRGEASDAEVVASAMSFVVMCVLPIALINIYYLGRDGQTLGKKVLGIRIVRTSGDHASLGRLVLMRSGVTWFLSLIPYLGTLFGLIDTVCIFRNDRRCIHDLIADTKVVL